MTATASCPNPQVVEMTISDNFLYSETQIESLAMQLHDNPFVGAVSFRVLHMAGMLLPNEHTDIDPRYDLPATVICIDVPTIGDVGLYYYNNVALKMLSQLSEKMKDSKAYHLH